MYGKPIKHEMNRRVNPEESLGDTNKDNWESLKYPDVASVHSQEEMPQLTDESSMKGMILNTLLVPDQTTTMRPLTNRRKGAGFSRYA